MKKVIVLVLIVIFTLGICACGGNAGSDATGGDDLVGQTMVSAPDSGNYDTGTNDEESSDVGTSDSGTLSGNGSGDSQGSSGDSSSGNGLGSAIMPSTVYSCYDRFSGEGMPGYIRVHSSNSSQVVFDYVTSAGNFTYVTAYLDSGYSANVNLTDTLSLTMTFSDSSITVDEIEGMGAMAYVFVI